MPARLLRNTPKRVGEEDLLDLPREALPSPVDAVQLAGR